VNFPEYKDLEIEGLRWPTKIAPFDRFPHEMSR